jgi:hypothetical protein
LKTEDELKQLAVQLEPTLKLDNFRVHKAGLIRWTFKVLEGTPNTAVIEGCLYRAWSKLAKYGFKR